jgi:DNA polymerase kappa
VEQLERPELKDIPFAVGGGVLTTCNYVARQFGCRSGMAGFVAKKLCPSLVLLKPNFAKYNAKAHEVREVLVNYDPRFESASIDEAYLNITEYCNSHDMTAPEAVAQMREEIHQQTQITVSAGIAANSKLAKICSNINKPNGQYVLPNDRTAIAEFMRDLPTRKVNGIGRVLERELLEIGVKTCGDLYAQRQYLLQLFGEKTYVFLLQCYLGLGRTSIQPAEEYERKSVGTESTFGEMSDPSKLREKLRWTAEELEKDMKRAECKGRTLCLKVKLHTFEVYTRQVVTPKAIHVADDLYSYALPMLVKLEQEMPELKLRLMGLRCTHLVSTKRPDTAAFWGFRNRRNVTTIDTDPTTPMKRKADDLVQEWEDHDYLYQQCLESGAITPPGAAAPVAVSPHQDDETYRRHGKEIAPNPTAEAASVAEEEWWDCPICNRPQAADERLFNEHIDLCLSRQTIREAAQADDTGIAHAIAHEPKKPKFAEKRKGRTIVDDPRQRKLFFG